MLRSLITVFLGLVGITTATAKTINLASNNFVSLIGPVTSSSIDDVIKSLNSKTVNEYIQENKQIIVYINSPGGSVFSGNHFVQYIRALQSSNVSVDCIGQNFMSMGFIIMQSCSKRYALFDSIGMQHQMSLGMKGNMENFKSQFHMIERVNNILIDMEIKKIGIDKNEYLSKVISDWWSYGEENLKNGIVDEMITVRCNPSIMLEKVKKTENFLGFTFDIEISKCPILNDVKLSDKFASLNYSNEILIFYDFDNYAINVKQIINKLNL
jgi:ATP-dependent protease ClpP protease subunit